LKVGEPKFFLLILALKKHAMHNAITRINNSLMQLKIILNGVTSSGLLFSEHFCYYFESNIAYLSKGVWGNAASSPRWVRGGAPEAKAFLSFT